MIYKDCMMILSSLIWVGRNMPTLYQKTLDFNISTLHLNNKRKPERKDFSIFSVDNSAPQETSEFLGSTCMVDQELENHSFQICFSIIFQFKKKGKLTSTSLWLGFIMSSSNFKNKRKDMILWASLLKEQQRKQDYCTWMNSRSLMLLMLVYWKDFLKD